MNLTKLVALVAAGAAAALAGPAAASASSYCVGDPGGACDISKTATAEALQQVLSEAAASAADDVVRIGAGTYAGNFVYGSPSDVDIEGSGEATVIQGVGGQPALSVGGSGGAPTVSGITFEMASVPSPQSALGLRIGPGTAENVRVENPGDSWGTAVLLQPGGDVAGATILAGRADGIDEDGPASQHEVTDTAIRAGLGVRARSGVWNLERLQITARHGGVASYASTQLGNSLVRVAGVHDDPGSSYGVLQGGQGVLAVRHATIYAGPELTYGAWARNQDGAGTATIDMRNSIVAGPFVSGTFARSAADGGSASILVGHSNFAAPSPAQVGASTGAGSFQHSPGASNNALEPRFVDPLVTLQSPGVDFRLRHDSPLIDRGEPGGAQGEDLAGEARLADGDGEGEGEGDPVYDMGAYEYQHRPPAATIAAPLGGHVAAGAELAFSADGSRDSDAGDTLSYAWSFGDGAGATGPAAAHAYESGGERTATLTVTDPTGLIGTATVALNVDAGPAPADPGPGSGTGTGTDAGDRVAPAFSAASLSAREFSVGRRGTRVRFTLSEPASVRFGIARRSPARRVGGFTRQAVAGENAVRFRGRLGAGGRLRSLAPGRYRLTLVATDGAGNVSAARRLRFRIVR